MLTTVQRLAEVRVFDVGEGDPYVVNEGAGWYDILQETQDLLKVTTYQSRRPTLEYLDDVGIVCRPFVVYQDTRLSQYSTSAGLWEEIQPGWGVRVYRLCQTDTTANVQWSATSTFPMPADPHVCVSVGFAEVPGDHNFTTYPPFTMIEFGMVSGQYQWALFWEKGGAATVLRWDSSLGDYVSLGRTVEFFSPAGVTNGELLVYVRVHRGKLILSNVNGESTAFTDPFAVRGVVSIAGGGFKVSGTGGVLLFGFHQIKYYPGTFQSIRKPLGPRRVGTAAATFTPLQATPGGTSVSISSLPPVGSTYAQYGATLTPDTVAGWTGWTFYRSPALYAVATAYPVSVSGAAFTYTTPWASLVKSIRISKPSELDETSVSLTIFKEFSAAFAGTYRHRKILIRLREEMSDGSLTAWTIVFTGYITDVVPLAEEFGRSRIEVKAQNVAWRLKRAEWDDWTLPLGGGSVGDAMDAVLGTEGIPLNTSYRNWTLYTAGFSPSPYAVPLDFGKIEDPASWPKSKEMKWDTLKELAGFAQGVPATDDAGVLFVISPAYVAPTVTKTWEWNPEDMGNSGDPNNAIRRLSFGFDAGKSCTGVIVRGKDADGNVVWAYLLDTAAETLPASDRFNPWRERYSVDLPGTCSALMLSYRTLMEYRNRVLPRFEPDLEAPCDLSISRRHRVKIKGASSLGIGDADEFCVMTLEHAYEADPSGERVSTTAGLRRLPL